MRPQVESAVLTLSCLGITDWAADRHGVTISQRTFTALENHKKACEVTIYGLLRLLDPAEARTKLDKHFPCRDGVAAKEFRQQAFVWLSQLKKDHALGNSILRRSILDDAAGERYEDLIFALATHVYLHTAVQTLTQPLEKRILDSATSDDDLRAMYAIAQLRLDRYRKQRQRVIQKYRSFEQELRAHSTIPPLPKHAIDAGAEQDRGKMELRRLRTAGASTRVLSLISTPPTPTDPFFESLPWRPGPTNPRRTTSYVDTSITPLQHVEQITERCRKLRVSLQDPPEQINSLDKAVDKILRPTTTPITYHVTRTSWAERIRSWLLALQHGARMDSGSAEIVPDLALLRASLAPTTTVTPNQTEPSPRPPPPTTIKRQPQRQHDLLRQALSRPTPKRTTPNDYNTPETPRNRRDDLDLTLTPTARSVNRLVDLLGRSVSGSSRKDGLVGVMETPSRVVVGRREEFRLWDM
ncbi:hypothetical protein PYCC9005_000840 [Savitreella phatthalungensis]